MLPGCTGEIDVTIQPPCLCRKILLYYFLGFMDDFSINALSNLLEKYSIKNKQKAKIKETGKNNTEK